MNHEAKFNDTVGILVKAYINDTLMKDHCKACAVGNLVAAARGLTVVTDRSKYPLEGCAIWQDSIGQKAGVFAMWKRVFMTCEGQQEQDEWCYTGEAKEQIDATGYSWRELARIEYAFETAHADLTGPEAEYAGLMAVVDVLADIHGIDLTTAAASKALFVKAG